MSDVRAAFYLDFDNVFSGLFKLDPDAAVRFAADPAPWLRRLATALPQGGSRRWLILRCYLNPTGGVSHSGGGESGRLYFSRFRAAFVRAGFEVIDCPRYNATKNAADIRIVLDVMDALAATARYDEFIIASGDSDMAPLLQRLRREDRRTTIISPTDAFTSIADHLLDGPQLLALVHGEPVEFDDETGDSAVLDGEDGPLDHGDSQTAATPAPIDRDAAYAAFRDTVTAAFDAASAPMNMATLAHQLRIQLGPAIEASNWFGFRTFGNALKSLQLSNLTMSQHEMWDASRHPAYEPVIPPQRRAAYPEAVESLSEQLGLPRLNEAWWPAIYQTLSDYAHSYRFNLTECTSWARDQLAEQGFPVSRQAVGFVVRGTSFGGCPLHRQPPPNPAEIGAAFVDNLLQRAEASQLSLTDAAAATIRAWLGGSAPTEAGPDRSSPH